MTSRQETRSENGHMERCGDERNRGCDCDSDSMRACPGNEIEIRNR